jgi:two-component system cell cycle sensor histidine kinase/response regulator CckA
VEPLLRRQLDRLHLDEHTPPDRAGWEAFLERVARTYAEADRVKAGEEQRRQAQKMEAIGRLAGGIAHDFNNLLAVILGVTELALDLLDEDHVVRSDLREIETAGRRAALLTQQLLAFGRRQPCQPQVVSLNPIVTNMDKMLCRIVGEDIAFTSVLAPRLGSVEVDPGQIEQILLNLVVNARDAMPGGGTLTIATRNVDLGDAAAAEAALAPGRYVELSVTDTGTGMDSATRARIFEPFFTTKEVGKGTGLGLSTVFGIVKQAAGTIGVQSRPGRGATFRIHLPRVDDLPDSMPPESLEKHRHSHAETLLLVEDEDSVRRVLRRLLQSHGYTVIEASGAAAALRMLREGDCAVDLVITDLVMPDVDGRTLGEQIIGEHPGVKMLYMSGYPDHMAMKGRALAVADHFVTKPFTQEQMHEAVRRALAGGRRPTLAPPQGETRSRTGFPSSAAPASST